MSDNIVRSENFTLYHAGAMAEWGQYQLEPPHVPMKLKGKFFLKEVLGCNGMEMSLNSIPPGGGLPFFHKHQDNDEVYVVVGGRGQFLVDSRCLDVEEGSVIRMAPSVVRTFRNNSSEPMYFLCIQYRADSVIQGRTSDGRGVEEKPVWPAVASAK